LRHRRKRNYQNRERESDTNRITHLVISVGSGQHQMSGRVI
jgi:hypothetical protein